eukprot:2712204-Lingulodinium_polyedra.AAC.1
MQARVVCRGRVDCSRGIAGRGGPLQGCAILRGIVAVGCCKAAVRADGCGAFSDRSAIGAERTR